MNYSEIIGYEGLDYFKRAAIQAALSTCKNGKYLVEEPSSRGESAHVSWMKLKGSNLGVATVIEGLGTKSIVAEIYYQLTSSTLGFSTIAVDTIAMIINDLLSVGAKPEQVNMHLAVGNSNWMDDKVRMIALIEGWRIGCEKAGVNWTGGETPALKGIIDERYIELSGSAVGFMNESDYLTGTKIREGDCIVVIESSGIHANGITAARIAADTLPLGYMTLIPAVGGGEQTFGEAVLTPTIIYAELMRALAHENVEIHYAVNITGHGWRKIMRADVPFQYVINRLPKAQPIFGVIQRTLGYTEQDMYQDFNMGGGFALILSKDAATQVTHIAKETGYKAYIAGTVIAAKSKSVHLVEKGISFAEEELQLK